MTPATPPEETATAGSSTTGRFWWVVVLITVAGFAWRAWGLETPAFDHDEVYEVTQRTTDLAELYRRHDGFPPLYRWLVAWVIELTGRDMALRWFSLVVGAATVPFVALLGRRLGGDAAGIAAAALFACSANHVLLCQHGRGYALLVLFATLMLLIAWRVRETDRWSDWVAFLASSWLGVATHYFVGLLLVLLGGMLLIEKRGALRRRAILAAVLLAIAGLPLVACLRVDLADTGEFHHEVGFDPESYAFSYLWLVTGNTLGPSVSELREMVSLGDKRGAILSIAPWAALAAAPVVVLLSLGWRRLGWGDRSWLAVLLIAPPLLAAVAGMASPTGYNYRYLVWMLVPFTAWLAVGAVAPGHRALARVAALLLVTLGVAATLNRHLDPRYAENDFHAVTALIESRASDEAPPAVLAAPLYYGSGVIYSLPADWVTQNVSAHPSGEQDWDAALPAFAERVGARGEVWLVAQWFPKGHPQRAVCDELADRIGAELVERVSSTVMVYRADAAGVR